MVFEWENPQQLVSWAINQSEHKNSSQTSLDTNYKINGTLKTKNNNSDLMSNLILENLLSLNTLKESLQKEFEFMLSSFYQNEIGLRAKKIQIENLNLIISYQNKILIDSFELFYKHEKTELCLINHGVSKFEYLNFLKAPICDTLSIMESNKVERMAPETSNKPVVSFEKLKQLAKHNPGILVKP